MYMYVFVLCLCVDGFCRFDSRKGLHTRKVLKCAFDYEFYCPEVTCSG